MGPPSRDSSLVDVHLSASSANSIGQLVIPLSIPALSCSVPALVDSGTSDSFLDSAFARKHGLKPRKLLSPRNLRLFDGGLAPAGPITHSIALKIVPPNGKVHSHLFLLSTLDPSAPIVLGIDWLSSLNPSIDWETSDLSFKQTP